MLAHIPAEALVDQFGGYHWPDGPSWIWERRLRVLPWPTSCEQRCVPCGNSYGDCARRTDVRPAAATPLVEVRFLT